MNLPHSIPRHKLSLKAHHQLARAGVIDEDSRVELIHGELIDMAPIGSRHVWMPEVWLFDLRAGLVEVNLEATAKGHRRRLERKNTETLCPLCCPTSA